MQAFRLAGGLAPPRRHNNNLDSVNFHVQASSMGAPYAGPACRCTGWWLAPHHQHRNELTVEKLYFQAICLVGPRRGVCAQVHRLWAGPSPARSTRTSSTRPPP